MTTTTSRTLLIAVLSLSTLAISSCRSRATRSTAARTTKPAAAPTNGTGTAGAPTAKSVLSHADSALTRISQLGQDDRDTPPYAAMETAPYSAPMSYAPQPSISDYGTYQAALAAYNRHDYGAAISMFSQVTSAGRPAELVPNAYYWMGEAYYAMGQYQQAMPYFEYVTKVGPQYKREMSLYKLSRGSLRAGNKDAANMWYERLRNDYPKSSYARTLAKLGTR